MPWVVTLTILVASAFLMDMSFTMITPFLPVYLSSELGTKASEVDMWSGAVFAVTFFDPFGVYWQTAKAANSWR